MAFLFTLVFYFLVLITTFLSLLAILWLPSYTQEGEVKQQDKNQTFEG
ncbi:hypothetical protein FM109_12905 [Vibrio casei]|nr:hypothetical protein FM109_12905 [Vibrio casei]